MKKRVECYYCVYFIKPKLKDENNLFSGVVENAKCKLGKRVMFRKPRHYLDENFGYFRYCDEFKKK